MIGGVEKKMARVSFSKPDDLLKTSSKVLDLERGSRRLIIGIPRNVVEILKLEKGDSLTWIDYDPETGIIRLKKD